MLCMLHVMLNSIVCTPTRIVRAPSEAAFILKEHEYVYLPWRMYVAIFSLSSIYVFKYTVCLFVCLWELLELHTCCLEYLQNPSVLVFALQDF